jgi:integrase
MGTNTSEAKDTDANGKNRTKTGQKYPKNSARYWESRVKLRPGLNNGLFYARLFQGDREAWVCLDTANREVAGRVAKKHYETVRANGLDALLRSLEPALPEKPARVCTVGELITAAARVAQDARARTIDFYANNLRRIVAAVAGVEGGRERFNPRCDAWRRRIDAVSLDVLTEAAVTAWQKAYVATGVGHAAQLSRAASARAIIRNARALLGQKGVEKLVTLPTPLPFTGLSAKADTRRHKPTVRPSVLHAAAWRDLSHDGEALAAFLLLLVAGLRRGEADYLEWSNVHLDGDGSALDGEGPRVDVQATRWWRPKTAESERSVPIPGDVVTFLRGLREANPGADFVLRGRAPKANASLGDYRAYCWDRLAEWLRRQGVTARCPLHELRKMSGSFVNAVAGLEAARRHLGHRSITTTANSYAAAEPVTVALGAAKTEVFR